MKKQFQFQKKNKEWQQEFQDVDDQAVLEKIELPPSEDEEQPVQQEQQQIQQKSQEDGDELEIVEEKEEVVEQSNQKQKKIEWLDSDIEGVDEIDDEEEMIEDADEVDHDQKTIFVQGLPLKISDKEIVDFFSEYGTIVSIEIPRNEGSQFTKRRAFVEYHTVSEAQSVAMLDLELKGCQLKIRIGIQQNELNNNNKQNNRSRSRSQSK
ncbi:unnamed protein product (macronuclear) [Paramecium tetraurelia]|uniref:RRM domain-containing protein n=1 Tax=Paramecium tetraurelia TaxID=5888 RepID=A0E769_PARTE|nr:uncharacterized protein GSPATT00023864001 [Paramecium tetraurelia]CAK91136.1 unnamed protein product [Paramecium tetraurelia]|eukprot:XP_001458533.1 hypothetical protein (macronuclear) [Paramecium tetraurelia strain d4-2]